MRQLSLNEAMVKREWELINPHKTKHKKYRNSGTLVFSTIDIYEQYRYVFFFSIHCFLLKRTNTREIDFVKVSWTSSWEALKSH
jgi:CMP-N-acetylneuraminic acid synthetase